MQFYFTDSFFGYLTFFRKIVGNHLFFYLFVTVVVGLLDGFGLAMFIPLLTVAAGESMASGGDGLGNLKFLTDGISSIGLPLSLNVVLVFLVLIFVIKGILRYFQSRYMAYIRFMFLTKVRKGILHDLQLLSYRGFTELDSGRIQNNMVGEVIKLFGGMTGYFSGAQNLILLSTYVMLAFVANWQFAILISFGSFLTNLLFKRIYSLTKKASKSISLKGHDFNAFLIQAVVYFKYLKATNYFPKYALKLKTVIDETEELNFRMGKYSSILIGAREPMTIIIISLVIGVQVNYFGGSLGSIMVSLLFFYRALTSLGSLQTNWQSFIQSIGSMHAVSSISKEMQSRAEISGKLHYTKPFDSLVTRNLCLSYGETVILNNVNIRIDKNQTIALVGESGAGKTSLANMIVGLIQPSYGQVLINGEIDLSEFKLEGFRNKVGYITQDPVIFNDTVFNNITFWDEPNESNYSKFNKALEIASLTNFIELMPEKEHTILGDHGMLVSGGQKQRISIARELYKEVELLILDEATSALDSETEQVIKDNINKLKGKYTMIIIAHRLSTIREADVIYLMGEKGITFFGSFDELNLQSTQFRKMVSLQSI